MLYLNLYGLPLTGRTVPSSFHEFLKDCDRAVLFFGGRASLCGLERGNTGKIFHPIREKDFSERHAETLFGGERHFENDENLFDRLGLNPGGPDGWVLHVKEKKGTYLRLLLVCQRRNFFTEKYVGWEKWTGLKKEFDAGRGVVNSLVKKTLTEKASGKIADFGALLSDLISLAGLPDFTGKDKAAFLDVYYGQDTALLPFEAFSADFSVRHFLPVKKRNGGIRKEGVAIVYAESLAQAKKEAAEITAAAKERLAVELFSDRLYDPRGNNDTDGLIFHFAGHGTVSEGKGSIHLGDCPAENHSVGRRAGLAFLHCCHVGSVAEGVVSAFLDAGAESVIASPYEIPDSHPPVSGFYKGLLSEDIGLSWRLFCRKNPYFGRFFRFFSSY